MSSNQIPIDRININLLVRMLAISQRMAETRVLAPLLEYAIGEALDLVGAERGYLVLLRKDGSLDFRVKRDQHGNVIDHVEDQISRSILDQTINTRQPRVVRNAVEDPGFEQSLSVQRLRLRSVMCVPLIARGEILGAIYVENRSHVGQFEDEDVLPLSFFANHAAVAIENALLNDELEARVTVRTAELERAWHEAVEANRRNTFTLGNIAHDLRSPLSIAKGALTMMLDGSFGELNNDVLEWIASSLRGVDRALALTEDVFTLALSDARGIELELKDEDLASFLNEIHRVGAALPWPEGVRFEIALQALPPLVRMDANRIHQVVLNLITNALKFTDQGAVTLHARTLAPDDLVVIGVQDTGRGIAPEFTEKVFQRYHQIEVGDGHVRKGGGLGLAICRELVAQHGGQIWVESALDEGSNFMFTLPIAGPPEPYQPDDEGLPYDG